MVDVINTRLFSSVLTCYHPYLNSITKETGFTANFELDVLYVHFEQLTLAAIVDHDSNVQQVKEEKSNEREDSK